MAATSLRVALESYTTATASVTKGEVRIFTNGVVTAGPAAYWATIDDVTHAGGKVVLLAQQR